MKIFISKKLFPELEQEADLYRKQHKAWIRIQNGSQALNFNITSPE
jgi:hypothetical protein